MKDLGGAGQCPFLKSRRGPYTVIVFCLLLAGCGSSNLGQLAVGTVFYTVEKTHKLVTPGKCRDIALKGDAVATPEGIPAFSAIKGLELVFTYDIWRVHSGIEYRALWRRGEYLAESSGRIGAGRKAAAFPHPQVATDLGQFWAGLWSVELIVKGRSRETLPFRLVNDEAGEHLVGLADRYRQQGQPALAERMLNKARECNPFREWTLAGRDE